MSVEVVSIIVLCVIFLIATLLPIHMGVLAISAAFAVGMIALDGPAEDKVETIADGFPGDLFIILAGVTFLFAIAKNNGTVDWLVHAAVQSVRGRVAFIPWVMFLVTAALAAVGAVVPAAVAIIAPVGMNFARRYGISTVLMGLMIINGATAGGFSPISIFGTITNGVVERSNLEGSPLFLFLASFVFNVILGIITFIIFGGRRLIGMRDSGEGTLVAADGQPVPGGAGSHEAAEAGVRSGPAEQTGTLPSPTTTPRREDDREDGHEEEEAVTSLNALRALTLVGLVGLAVGALFFDLDVGFSAFVVGALLSLADPKGAKGAVNQIAWPTVLLVCGIVTYVTLMEEELGTIEFLGDEVAGIGAALFAALLICFIGGVVSAFASTTGILAALIPLAVPFLQGDNAVGAIGLITALAISSSVVDSSPFSTSGSLVLANAQDDERDVVFRRLVQWGFSMVALAPIATWLVLIVPGWL